MRKVAVKMCGEVREGKSSHGKSWNNLENSSNMFAGCFVLCVLTSYVCAVCGKESRQADEVRWSSKRERKGITVECKFSQLGKQLTFLNNSSDWRARFQKMQARVERLWRCKYSKLTESFAWKLGRNSRCCLCRAANSVKLLWCVVADDQEDCETCKSYDEIENCYCTIQVADKLWF